VVLVTPKQNTREAQLEEALRGLVEFASLFTTREYRWTEAGQVTGWVTVDQWNRGVVSLAQARTALDSSPGRCPDCESDDPETDWFHFGTFNSGAAIVGWADEASAIELADREGEDWYRCPNPWHTREEQKNA
jgi:hypothetical protein